MGCFIAVIFGFILLMVAAVGIDIHDRETMSHHDYCVQAIDSGRTLKDLPAYCLKEVK